MNCLSSTGGNLANNFFTLAIRKLGASVSDGAGLDGSIPFSRTANIQATVTDTTNNSHKHLPQT